MKKLIKRIVINMALFIPVLIVCAMACVFSLICISGHIIEVSTEPLKEECADFAEKIVKKMKNKKD